MKSKYGSKHIDQIFLEGIGWRAIARIRLRDLGRPIRSELVKLITRVHIVGKGDYTMAELRRRTKGA